MNPCVGRNFGGEDGVLKILLAPPFCVSVCGGQSSYSVPMILGVIDLHCCG